MKKLFMMFMLLSFTGVVFAEGVPAYSVPMRVVKNINVDGKLLTMREFKNICKEKSPRAYEQLRYCIDKRTDKGLDGILGLWSAVTGYNRYMESRGMTDNETAVSKQAEGIGFMLLAAVFMINGHTSEIAAQNAQEKAIEYYNIDTSRVKVSLGVNADSAGITLSKRF